MSSDSDKELLDQANMDQDPVEQMDQDSTTSKDKTMNGDVDQETPDLLDHDISREMEQDPSNGVEPGTNGMAEQGVEEQLQNGHLTSGKESEADQVNDGASVNGYLRYDVDGNVVLAEGDFVVGIEEVVGHDGESSELILNGGGGVTTDSVHQAMEDDDRVLAYIAADDLDKLVGLAETEITSDGLAAPHSNGGYDNHLAGLEDDEGDDEEEEEEYEEGNDNPEEVGESLETAEAEEPLGAEEVAEVGDERNLGLKFPLTRVKRIMKADPDMQLVSQDAVFLITKATELFVEVVADAAYHHTLQAGRKTLLGRDLDACIDLIDALAFLDGALDADQ